MTVSKPSNAGPSLSPHGFTKTNTRYSLGGNHENGPLGYSKHNAGWENQGGTRASAEHDKDLMPPLKDEENVFPPNLLGNPECRPLYPCPPFSLKLYNAGSSPGLCLVLEWCKRETLPKLGVQHGEVSALLPWEAAAAPAENTALDPPTQENPVQIPQPAAGNPLLGFSVSQSGFRFRASLCRKRREDDANEPRRRWFRK